VPIIVQHPAVGRLPHKRGRVADILQQLGAFTLSLLKLSVTALSGG
jgi:hypothetical protein